MSYGKSLVLCTLAAALLSGCSGGATTGATAGGGASASANAAGPGTGPGWTGVTNPKEVIAARFHLMEQMEQLMLPIDMLQVPGKGAGNTAVLHANAAAVAAMLQAVPHLFPPTTDLYDPKAEMPATIALPAIWKDFGSFYALAGAAAKAASTMAAAEGKDAQRTASAQLRASCDACHALFLRKYEKPKTQASDKEFDFDSALPGK